MNIETDANATYIDGEPVDKFEVRKLWKKAEAVLGVADDLDDVLAAKGEAVSAKTSAESSAVQALAAAEVVSNVSFYDTYALADAALAGLANGDVVEVFNDETQDNARTRYVVEAGSLVFKLRMDQEILKAVGPYGFRYLHSDMVPLGGGYSSSHALLGNLRASAILSGWSNSIDGGGGAIGQLDGITIAGGKGNQVTATYDGDSRGAFIGGGFSNILDGYYSFIGGGKSNQLNGDITNYSVIVGGDSNEITGAEPFLCFIGGGRDNQITANFGNRCVIVGGGENVISGAQVSRASIVGGERNEISGQNAFYALMGGGQDNEISGQSAGFSILLGGKQNQITGSNTTYSFLGGGELNQIAASNGTHSAIVGGRQNEILNNASYSTILGGYLNWLNGQRSVICGGYANKMSGASGTQNVIGGGNGNEIRSITVQNSIISGGFGNIIGVDASGTVLAGVTIAGGEGGEAVASGATILGGKGLQANSFREVVRGQYNLSANPDGVGTPSKTVYVGGQIAESLGIGSDDANRANAYVWLKNGKQIRYNTPIYADNAAAISAGELIGTVYRKPTGELMEVF